jgi:hypothetical protein
MDIKIKFVLVAKILELCGCNKENAVYSFITEFETPTHFSKTYTNSINSIPNFIESASEIFCQKKTNIAKTSYELQKTKENQQNFIQLINENKDLINLTDITLNDNKTKIALGIISNIYLESFVRPVQFFLPHSSACSGQWSFWENDNYFKFLEKINGKKFFIEFNEEIMKSEIWGIKFKPEDFPEIIKRRLIKEKACEKKLDSNAMIKAMIIRLGEIAKPNINYEVIDYSIRNLFTYLNTNKYLRVDREIKFLRMFEKEVIKRL